MNKKDWMRHFACRVMGRLGALDWTQTELSRRTGIGESTLSLYLSCKRVPKAYIVNNIAKALGVTTDWLIGIDEMVDVGGKK